MSPTASGTKSDSSTPQLMVALTLQAPKRLDNQPWPKRKRHDPRECGQQKMPL